MQKRKLGNTDMDVSVLGFGGAEVGFAGSPEDTVKELLDAALDAGLNVIDTAECYNMGEELVGKTVSQRRDDYYLFTKAGHPDGLPKENWEPESILKSIERSLKRLRTDYVDVVFLHSCAEDVLKKGEATEAVREARRRGWTRYIGYSGDSSAARYAIECGDFDVLETSLNIADQEAIDLTIPLARDKNMGVVVKRPIANAAWRTGAEPADDYHKPYWQRLEKLNYDFLEQELAQSIETALRFTLGVPGVATMIVGTTKPGRWQENAASVGKGPLPQSEFDAIRARWKEVADASWHGLM